MSEGINIAEAYDKGRALFMGIELLVAPGARPHFRAALAAARADEVRFDVGQPHMMGPGSALSAMWWLQRWSRQ